ncbi:MAG: BON domain-containing protein [Chloroflexota bacterium]
MSHQEGSELDRELVMGVPRDQEIETEIKDAFAWDGRLDAGSIRVGVCNSAVTLSGYVRTDHEKAMAGQIAEGIAGVTDVDNDLKVTEEEPCE